MKVNGVWINALSILFLTLILNFLSIKIYAAEIYPFFRGVRAQAMGGAAIATVNDESALFLNPSGLGKIRGPYIALANLELEANYDTNTALFGTMSGVAAINNSQQFMDAAKRYPEKHMHARFQTQPTFVTTNFALGVYGSYRIDSEYTPSTDIYHLDYFNDYAAAIGYCFRLWEGRIKIGLSGKIVNRVYVNRDIPNASTVTNLELVSIASEGTGAGWDGSLMLSAPWVWLPTITAVMHDIADTKFNLGNGYFFKTGVQPPPQKQSTDVGIGVFPIFTNSTRGSFTVEYRDIQNPETQDIYRRLHAGAEINFSDIFFLRGGMNQSYYTAGIELSLLSQQFQLTTYGEEIGTATLKREDRRFIFQYGFRF